MDQHIRAYMTPSPRTIGQEQSLAKAHKLMREFEVRHLPVLHGGALVGIVSLRDLAWTEAMDGVDPEQISVEEAMSSEPDVFAADASLREVVEHMADKKQGAALIVEGGKVVGVFTEVDAVRALRDALQALKK